MINIFILIAFAGILMSAVICRPDMLAGNEFLVDFVDHEGIALLAVILTITLASIANAHLSINRIILRVKDNSDHVEFQELLDAAQDVKKETKDDAWYIFFGFVAALLSVIIKGGINELYAIAIIHALVLWIYALFLVCLFDIHRIIFGLAKLELDLAARKS